MLTNFLSYIYCLLCCFCGTVYGSNSSLDDSFSRTDSECSLNSTTTNSYNQLRALIFARDGIDRFDYQDMLKELDPKNIVFIVPKESKLSEEDRSFFGGFIVLENYVNGHEELYQEVEKLYETFQFQRLAFYSERDPYRAHFLKEKYSLEYVMTQEECALFRDKRVMHEKVLEAGFLTPASIWSGEEHQIHDFVNAQLQSGKTAFAKPYDGMGCIGGKKITTIQDLENYLEKIKEHAGNLEDHIFQEFIDAPSYHIDMHTSRDGNILGIWPSRYLYTPYEVVSDLKPLIDYLMPESDPLTRPLINYGRSLFQKFPMIGGSGVHLEVFAKEDKIWFGEWAMRPTGSGVSVCWKYSLGIDLHWASIREQLGLPTEVSAYPISVSGNVIIPKKGPYFSKTPSVRLIEELLGVKDVKTQQAEEKVGSATFSTDALLSANVVEKTERALLKRADGIIGLAQLIYDFEKPEEEIASEIDNH